ncbi:hypothetical protein [Aquimarina mytili]|uniref:DUF2846 domain-containing protein n=1 Tax=Aquimarina mytili TaxID=874423 RepID=A0A936ZSI9_9FLAO|nr:hypothetical protein [Aquimarina mytili]MBL0683883.1 hypothetical protein [Aquimarina mytili]
MKIKFCLIIIFFQSLLTFSQSVDSPSEEKTIVYFTRASTLGALINFTYFDGEKPIGRFNGYKYMKYECSPGEHLFWARSENKSFVEANLEAGKIYLIDVIPQIGGIKAAVKLIPVDINKYRKKYKYRLKRIQKLISKREPISFDENELEELKEKMTDVVTRGLKKHSQMEKRNLEVLVLSPELTVTKEDLIFVKKKRK